MQQNKQNYALNNMCIHLVINSLPCWEPQNIARIEILGGYELQGNPAGDSGPCTWSSLQSNWTDNDIHSYHFTCHRSQPLSTDWLHHSSPNLPVRFPLTNFLHDKHREGPVLLRNKRSFQQTAWLALNIWDLPELLAQWFEKAVSPVETASMVGGEKLFFSLFLPVVTG